MRPTPAEAFQKWQKLFGEDFGKSISKHSGTTVGIAMAATTVTPRKPYAR